MSSIDDLKREILQFRDERDWSQFHNPKDLAIAVNIEASELLEEYLWKSSEDASLDRVQNELADILIYSILLADKCDIDLGAAIRIKLDINRKKYPVEKAIGSAEKYTRL